ncbi:hypothetical protein OVY29_21290 [Sphingopyxis sp. SE2]|uniref:hypothetical protein n=1 Tax=Sphingopyxis sp. SE2 TaxID=1586240 RepID=UPI0028C100D3|nr:hypothetical protein [Sphingopyxis sp. SE2]MDT7531203.1 hypothetical protein [Sphingopyxis sp. SE2]
MARYDLVAIGTGTAAKKVALACRRAGWSVAVVDEKPFGGTWILPLVVEGLKTPLVVSDVPEKGLP